MQRGASFIRTQRSTTLCRGTSSALWLGLFCDSARPPPPRLCPTLLAMLRQRQSRSEITGAWEDRHRPDCLRGGGQQSIATSPPSAAGTTFVARRWPVSTRHCHGRIGAVTGTTCRRCGRDHPRRCRYRLYRDKFGAGCGASPAVTVV